MKKRDHHIWRIVASLGIIFSLVLPIFAAAQNDDDEGFLADPLTQIENEGRNLEACLSGWRDFISAGVGYTDFIEYWKDFTRWPAHYADIENVQTQLNKARYAVMSAFMRCEVDRIEGVTRAFYKLESELFFLRKFVETDGGTLKNLTEGGRKFAFRNELVNNFKLRTKNPEDEVLFSAYFDEFTAKYKDRAKNYGEPGGDAIYDELGEKVKKLQKTLQSFKEFSDELESLNKETVLAAKESAVSFANAPGKALKNAAANIASRFDACAVTPNDEFCLSNGLKRLITGESGDDNSEEADPFADISRAPRTFNEINVLVRKAEVVRANNIDINKMRERYEFLYGVVNGSGVKEVVDRADALIQTIGAEDVKRRTGKATGSIKVLKQAASCAAIAPKRQCQ